MDKQAYLKMMGLQKKTAEEVGDLGQLQHKKRLSQDFRDWAKVIPFLALSALIGKKARGFEGAIGGGILGLLGTLGAKFGGAVTGSIAGPRSLSEYRQYLKDRPWSDWLVPGKIAYNRAREKATLDALQRNKALEFISGLQNKG